MGFSAKLGVLAIVAAVGGGALFAADTISAAMTGEAAIKARKEAMKSISADWKVVNAFVKEGKGTAKDVAKKASEIAETMHKLSDMFPKGSGRPDVSDKETRALPAIWTDMAGFDKAQKVMIRETELLAKTAEGGDKDAIAKQVAQVGKLGCGGCHKAYRGAKAK